MSPIRRRNVLASVIALIAFLGPMSLTSSRLVATELLPSQLSDDAFWNMVTEFSEPNGYFRADNFVSNETTFQYVIRDLKKVTPGGVYLGVGPDQNFTYVVAMHPKMAIIFDIRRQNMLQHLMYKALIEMSSDRADFISRLFSRRRPASLESNLAAAQLFLVFDNVPTDRDFFVENLHAIKKQLVERHGFKLSAEDEGIIDYIFRAFFAGGPDLTYNGVGGGPGFGRGRMPSYSELMQMTDGEGQNRSYLGSEENFKALKDLENKNLIIPIVGDFAGSKAIRAVANYLKDHDAHVTAFYVSNVEQYLFQQNDDWSKFYRNVEMLPVDATGTFIRSVFNGITVNYQQSNGFMRSASVLSSIPGLLKAFGSGDLKTYYDVIQMSK